MSDNTTTPVQAPLSDDKSKTRTPSNDRKAEEASKPADDKSAGDQATDQKP